tara:strand:- start:2295 stop:2609 length:315 start_codon:yes stop_codon:yes gene_type:complete
VVTPHVICPVCDTPCSLRATHYDVCDQRLGETPDLEAMDAERRDLRTKLLFGVGAAAGIAAFTFALAGGMGLVLVVPGALLGRSAVRYRELSRRLRRLREPTAF